MITPKRIRAPRTSPRYRYLVHAADAKRRGIPFLLTYEEWLCIWMESGRWSERGNRRGQYVMARFGDQGAYEADNVKICLAEENRAERNQNYPMKGENHPNFGKDTWATLSPEARTERAVKWGATMAGYVATRRRDAKGRLLPREIN